jgi:hypothetical protein
MRPICDVRPMRLGQLLTTLTMGIATLIAAAILFGAALYADAMPSFHQRLPLSLSQSLEVSLNPSYCCCAMSEMDCLHTEGQFRRAFQIVYRSSSGQVTLVSVTLPLTH